MIQQINYKHSIMSESDSDLTRISSTSYPVQDTNKLGKIILMRFSDISDENIINNRFAIDKTRYTTYKLDNSGYQTYFLILRWDKEDGGFVILMDYNGRVLVALNTDVIEQVYPNDYVSPITTNSKNFRTFPDKTELSFVDAALTDKEFISKYSDEIIHLYPLQDMEKIGIPVYTEYYNDIKNSKITTNVLERELQKPFSEIKKELIAADPKRDVLQDQMLQSFPLYFDAHRQSYVDTPFRSINKGIILRADCGVFGNTIVVMEQIGTTARFITDYEASFYIDTDNYNTTGDSRVAFKDIISKYTLSEGNS